MGGCRRMRVPGAPLRPRPSEPIRSRSGQELFSRVRAMGRPARAQFAIRASDPAWLLASRIRQCWRSDRATRPAFGGHGRMSRVDDALARLFGLLSFAPASCAGPAASDWPELLQFCDRTQITLLLENIPPSRIPDQVRREVEVRAAKNAERGERLWAAYEEISRQF